MGFWSWIRPGRGGLDVPGAPASAAQGRPASPAAPLPPAPPVKAALPPPGAPLLALAKMGPADRRTALLRGVVNPTLAWLADLGVPSDDRARVALLAITGQEGECAARRQVPVAHAMGLWQFERGGATAGVLSHRATMLTAGKVCAARGVRAISTDVWQALERDDVLACAFARLLLWTDARPLPSVWDEAGAWDYYLRNWRPGKPHPERWPDNHRLARDAVGIR